MEKERTGVVFYLIVGLLFPLCSEEAGITIAGYKVLFLALHPPPRVYVRRALRAFVYANRSPT